MYQSLLDILYIKALIIVHALLHYSIGSRQWAIEAVHDENSEDMDPMQGTTDTAVYRQTAKGGERDNKVY